MDISSYREKFLALREQLQRKARESEQQRVKEHQDAMSKLFLARERDITKYADDTRHKTQLREAARLASDVTTDKARDTFVGGMNNFVISLF